MVLLGGLGLAAVRVAAPAEPTGPVAPVDVPSAVARREIPARMLATYQRAARVKCPGLHWAILAGIGKVETDHGRNRAVSTAGARGPMQFLPSSWASFGIDGDGDGRAEITDPADSVFTAARYLCASHGDQPIWNYNHADWYVTRVLRAARTYSTLPPIPARG
jgi:membrane-bound lytic murein transglycosylase B